MFPQSPLERIEAIWQKHCLWTTSLHTALCTLHNTHCTIWTWWMNAVLITISLLNSVQCSPSSVHFAVLWWMSALFMLISWFLCESCLLFLIYCSVHHSTVFYTNTQYTSPVHCSVQQNCNFFSYYSVINTVCQTSPEFPTYLCDHCLLKTFPQLVLTNIQQYLTDPV